MIQKADLGNGYTIAELQKRKKTNKDTQDSYAMARNIWFGVAGLSLTAAIVLYVW
jgi:ABC-type transporter lipoprotein component MlaA